MPRLKAAVVLRLLASILKDLQCGPQPLLLVLLLGAHDQCSHMQLWHSASAHESYQASIPLTYLLSAHSSMHGNKATKVLNRLTSSITHCTALTLVGAGGPRICWVCSRPTSPRLPLHLISSLPRAVPALSAAAPPPRCVSLNR
jgi:hypothetical protein